MPVTEDDIEAAIAARDAVLRSARTPYDVDHREAMRAALEAVVSSGGEGRERAGHKAHGDYPPTV